MDKIPVEVITTLGYPAGISVLLIIAIVVIVKFFIKEHKDERAKMYNQMIDSAKESTESNKALAEALTELKIIIRSKND